MFVPCIFPLVTVDTSDFQKLSAFFGTPPFWQRGVYYWLWQMSHHSTNRTSLWGCSIVVMIHGWKCHLIVIAVCACVCGKGERWVLTHKVSEWENFNIHVPSTNSATRRQPSPLAHTQPQCPAVCSSTLLCVTPQHKPTTWTGARARPKKWLKFVIKTKQLTFLILYLFPFSLSNNASSSYKLHCGSGSLF